VPEIKFKKVKPQRGLISGRVAGSFAEWMVALALWRMKLRFSYKYKVWGTRFVIDFYIDGGPSWVPVDVRQFGGFSENSVQRFRRQMIERILNRKLVIVWDFQVSTFEEAITTMRRVVR
jgi:predicted AAA+ superfamily ATPase